MTITTTDGFSWDAPQYQRYAGERDRPFFDLTTRIDASAPATVLDLGCGDARLTRTLKQRWPDADVSGIDTSAAMLDDARTAGRDRDVAVGRRHRVRRMDLNCLDRPGDGDRVRRCDRRR